VAADNPPEILLRKRRAAAAEAARKQEQARREQERLRHRRARALELEQKVGGPLRILVSTDRRRISIKRREERPYLPEEFRSAHRLVERFSKPHGRMLGRSRCVARDEEDFYLRAQLLGLGGEINSRLAWHNDVGKEHVYVPVA
jgi:hypothetical protein